MALTHRADTAMCAGWGWQIPSLPSQPYLPIRGLFASSSDIGKVLDDLLCVLSLASTRFSTVGGKGSRQVKHEEGSGSREVEQ